MRFIYGRVKDMETQVKVLGQCITIPLLLLWILPSIQTAKALPIAQFWENETGTHKGLLLDPRVSFYNTSQNFGTTSQATPLPSAASVSQMYYDFNLSYALTEDWYLFGRASALTSRVSTPGAVDTSVTGFGDQMIGTSYRLVPTDKGLGFNLQFSATLPAYTNPASPAQRPNTDPYKGDDSIDLTTGGFVEIPISSVWSVEAGGGYTYRSKGYSAAIPWSVMIQHTPEIRGPVFAIGARGQVSLNTDKTSIATVTADQLAGAGGSDLISALNPSWIQVKRFMLSVPYP